MAVQIHHHCPFAGPHHDPSGRQPQNIKTILAGYPGRCISLYPSPSYGKISGEYPGSSSYPPVVISRLKDKQALIMTSYLANGRSSGPVMAARGYGGLFLPIPKKWNA